MSCLYLVLFIITVAFGSVLTIQSRVYGGDELSLEAHKYLVRLKVLRKNGTVGRCSGSIIDKHWIITSAHCFNGKEIHVAVYHKYDKGSRMIGKAYPHDIIVHPEWNATVTNMNNRPFDIALLNTTIMKFNEYVQPIKLSKSYPRKGQSAIVAGFGAGEPDAEPPREGTVTIEWCRFGVHGLLCSDGEVRAGKGDSGGSLTSQGKLIGVTSASCKDVEENAKCVTIYVSVITNLKWLRETLLGS